MPRWGPVTRVPTVQPHGAQSPPPALLGAHPVAGPAQSYGPHLLGVTLGPQGKAGAPTSGAGLGQGPRTQGLGPRGSLAFLCWDQEIL